ncbi:MAG: hypothetical protein WCS67_08415 [Bacteroidales bacterium]
MHRFLLVITVTIAVLSGCSKTDDGGIEKKAELVSVKVSVTSPDKLRANSDSSIMVTLEPGDGAIEYTYLVTEGEKAENMDKEKILNCL